MKKGDDLDARNKIRVRKYCRADYRPSKFSILSTIWCAIKNYAVFIIMQIKIKL